MTTNNNKNFINSLRETSTHLFKNPPQDQTVKNTLLAQIDKAAQDRIISPSVEGTLKSSLEPLQDRQIVALSQEEQGKIFQIFTKTLASLPPQIAAPISPIDTPIDEGVGSAASAAEDFPTAARTKPQISKEALSLRTKACSSALKTLLDSKSLGEFPVKKIKVPLKERAKQALGFSLIQYSIEIPIAMQVLTPTANDLSLDDEYPKVFWVDYVRDQRCPETYTMFIEPQSAKKVQPLHVTAQSQKNCQAIVHYAEVLAASLAPDNPRLSKALKHAILVFTTQHLQNATMGIFRGALLSHLVEQGFDDFELTTQRVNLTISAEPPHSFRVETEAIAQLSHTQANNHPDVTPPATFEIRGGLVCQVNASGQCILEDCHCDYIAKITK